MGRINSFSLGQKIYPISGEHRFNEISFNGFVTDHSQCNRHQTNGTPAQQLWCFPICPASKPEACTKRTANINPIAVSQLYLSLDLALHILWDCSDLKPALSMSGQFFWSELHTKYLLFLFIFLSVLCLGNRLDPTFLEPLQQYNDTEK